MIITKGESDHGIFLWNLLQSQINQAVESIRLQIWTENLWYLMGHCAHLLLTIHHSKVCEVFHPSPCSLFTLYNSPVLVSNFSGSSTPRATLESPVFSRRCSHRDFDFVFPARATLQEGICCKNKSLFILLLIIKLVAMLKRCYSLKLTGTPPFYFNWKKSCRRII